MLRIAVIALIVAVLVIGTLTLFQRRLIYLTGAGQVPPISTALPGGSEWQLTTDDGLELTAWYRAAERPRTDGMSVLVAPGNAGNRADRAPLAEALSDAGFDVLLVDYRGYGGNPGSPTEAGLALDVRAGYDALRRNGFDSEQIVLFGESLGAAAVTAFATGETQAPIAGLVLRSPFVDLASVASDAYPFLPVRWLLWDDFPLLERIGEVDAPVAVVYGTADSIVDPDQSRRVAEAIPNLVTTVAIQGADHNDQILNSGPQVVMAVQAVAEA